MTGTQEGETILELSHRQLLAMFFIVVVLLGVFFSMGYIIGRNTARAGSELAAAAKKSGETLPASPIVVEPPVESARSQPETAAPAFEDKPSPMPPVPPAAAPPAAGQREAAPRPTGESKPAATIQASDIEPPPGSLWLQVVATKKAEADLLAGILTKKGFPTRTMSVPGQDLVRVLVGPFPDTALLSKTRAELEASGFKAFPRKY